MPCWGKKSIKIHPKSITKQLSNQHPNLHRFWSQLGFIFGGVWEPRWDQIASKIDLQIHQKIDHISDRSWDRFWPILGPNLELKMAQDPPSWSQDAPKSPPIAAWDSSWMLKRTLVYLKSIFHQFCIDFQPQTDLIFIDFWLIFWLIFMNFDLHFGSHFIDFERILEPILLHFNIDVAAQHHCGSMSHRSPKRGAAVTRRRRLQ